MSQTRIEFRCSEEEKKKVEEKAGKVGLRTGRYLLSESIYKRGNRRSGLRVKDRASICRISTCLNKISDGIEIEESKEQIIKECKELCQYLK